MKLTTEQRQVIKSFFNDVKLEKVFIDLYEYQLSLRGDIEFQNKGTIIGFGCQGEHLRAYIGKNADGFFVKMKTESESYELNAKSLVAIKIKLLANDINFEKNKELYTLTVPVKAKKEVKARTSKKSTKSSKSLEKKDKVLSKLKNRQRARKYSSDDFEDLADWTYCTSFNEDGYIYTLPNGNKIECDSKSEIKLLNYLTSKKLALAIGAQELCIKYRTAYRKNVDYFPDLIILTKDEHIAIIEVKPITAMSYHLNVEKYSALQDYCEERGYEYMMVDPDSDYMTFEDLQKMRIPKEIVNSVEWYLRKLLGRTDDCLLEKEDIPILYEQFSDDYKKGEFELYLHALIIQKGWYNRFKHGFKVFEKPQKDVYD